MSEKTITVSRDLDQKPCAAGISPVAPSSPPAGLPALAPVLQQLSQPIHPPFPLASVLPYPTLQRIQPRRSHLAGPHPPHLLRHRQSTPFQNLQMLSHRRQRNTQPLSQLRHRCRTLAQPVQHRPPRSIPERMKHPVHIHISLGHYFAFSADARYPKPRCAKSAAPIAPAYLTAICVYCSFTTAASLSASAIHPCSRIAGPSDPSKNAP